MSPQLKFTYFNFTARSEAVRLAFHIAGLPFEDERVSLADWPSLKPKHVYGQLPELMVDGQQFAQTGALVRYAGKTSGLYPRDDLAALSVDEIIETTQALADAAFRYNGKDEGMKRADRARLVEVDYPMLLGALERRLTSWGGKWAVGDEISVADLVIFNHVAMVKSGFLRFVPTDTLDDYERITAVYEKVLTLPKIQEWYEMNPLDGLTEP